MRTFFSDYDEEGYGEDSSEPIWTIDLNDSANEDKILKWLNAEIDSLEDENESRMQVVERNLALYKGLQYRDMEILSSDVRLRDETRGKYSSKIVINHIFDLTTQKISRLVKYRPGVSILPTNEELQDRVAAKATKYLLDHIWYLQDFEAGICYDMAKHMCICGEAYLFITWDVDAGDLHPEYKKLKKQKVEYLRDDNGEFYTDENGNKIKIDRAIKTGDVVYEVVNTMDVLLERKSSWKGTNYLFRKKILKVEEARALYPKKADKIKISKGDKFNYETMIMEPLDNEVIVWEFYHKKTNVMNTGRHIVFTQDTILLNVEYPYSHGELPCVRLTDVDYVGQNNGWSSYDNIKGIAGTYNNLTNLIIRNQYLVSHPKWVYSAGSVRKEQLGNDITMVEFKGPTPPQLVTMNPTPNEIFTFREKLKEEGQQIYGIFGVSRGEPPPGIKAGVALQFLSEQESERANSDILKWNKFIQDTAIMTIAVAGDYYDESDERMIRVLGKNNRWMTVFFDAAHLSKDYDIRVQNSSALPQSRSARTQTLLDFNERFPDRFNADQIIDMLDLASNEKFIDSATVNIRSAEAENEIILDPEFVGADRKTVEAQIYEDHIAHWKTHLRAMQEYSFKNMTPKNIQDELIDHTMVHEMFMMDIARKNPEYAKKLSVLDGFPLFYIEKEYAPAPQNEEQPVPQGSGGGAGAFQPMAEAPVNEGAPPMDSQTQMNAPSIGEQLNPEAQGMPLQESGIQ